MTTLTDKQFVFESDHFPMFDYMNGLLPGEMVCMYNHSTWGQRQKGWWKFEDYQIYTVRCCFKDWGRDGSRGTGI